MPTRLHQMLIGLITRRMNENGFYIVACDGNDYYCNGENIRLPPAIIRHRPDILGYNFETKSVCIGEAKTHEDLKSKRTREQLLDFSNIISRSSSLPTELIIGIPKESENDLLELLQELKLLNHKNISYVWMPKELCEDGGET